MYKRMTRVSRACLGTDACPGQMGELSNGTGTGGRILGGAICLLSHQASARDPRINPALVLSTLRQTRPRPVLEDAAPYSLLST